jgi:restriction system protein
MRLRMHENSLFAILLRSPWWVSLAVAVGLFAGLRLVVQPLYASFFALPFLGVAVVAGWKQLRAPSRATIEKKLAALRELDTRALLEKVEAAFRAQGYEVTRLSGDEADLALERSGTRVLVACRRWKAARTGVEPLRALKDAAKKRSADCIYVVAGDLTPGAASFAAEQGIRLMRGAELAALA